MRLLIVRCRFTLIARLPLFWLRWFALIPPFALRGYVYPVDLIRTFLVAVGCGYPLLRCYCLFGCILRLFCVHAPVDFFTSRALVLRLPRSVYVGCVFCRLHALWLFTVVLTGSVYTVCLRFRSWFVPHYAVTP